MAQGSLSNYAENALLAHSLGKTAWEKPTITVRLYQSVLDDTLEGTALDAQEIAGNGYAPVVTTAETWSTPVDGLATNAQVIEFGPATQAWPLVKAVALTSTENNIVKIIWWGNLPQEKLVSTYSKLTFNVGDIQVALS